MDKVLSFLTKSLVDKAVIEIDKKEIPKNRLGTGYAILINNKEYPFKLLVTEAALLANVKVTSKDFSSNANNRLGFEQLTGYKVVALNNNTLEKLIDTYKVYLKKGGLEEELYKWKLLKEFKGKPNVNAKDFAKELKDINFANLVYPVAITAINHIAKDANEAYKACFNVLFDETKPLLDRISYFNSETLKIYRELVPEKRFSHHQDERTIATFLTYHNPEKYTFYKNSFYKSFCDVLKVKPKKKGEKYVHYLALINNFIEEYIKPDKDLITLFKSKLPNDVFSDVNFKILAQDILYQGLEKNDREQKQENEIDTNKQTGKAMSKNQILYGPPGTGKTYATKELAVKLINNNFIESLPSSLTVEERRKLIIDEYISLFEKEQIVFTTFHQSMGYEDFVEGIKPSTEKGILSYDIEDGIFKKLANKAKGIKGEISSKNKAIDFKKVNYFKMSIGGKNRKDIHNWCIENEYIALGYGTKNDLTAIIENASLNEFREAYINNYFKEIEHSPYSITAVSAFNYWMQKGDIVLVSLGNNIIDAVGVVRGDYEYKDLEEIPYHHFRKVEWLGTNLEADPSLFVDKNISQQTIYQFDNNDIKVDYLEQMFSKKGETEASKDHVLIIDEINRGNVSAIFGELITLLEADKRLGQDEAITVKLPYSKTDFGVPSNLHIIGTMNTADRSVEALDTALRRRFEFIEMMPKPATLKDILFDLDETSFTLEEVLTTINNRITSLLDRDYTIGHSYFIKIKSNDTKALANAFNNKVIPLLQEYFYGDYGKIGLVLGNDFVVKDSEQDVVFANFEYENKEDLQQTTYKLTTKDEDTIVAALISMLGKQVV